MTGRRSKRELIRAVEKLEAEQNAGGVSLADAIRAADGGPSRYTVVMDREQAEREGREILGPADTPGDQDMVKVEMEEQP